MLLVGYGKVRPGMKVRLSDDERYMTISASNPHIGKTYWIYKNSYGKGSGVDGYHLIIFNDYSHMDKVAYYFTGDVTTPGYAASNRTCDDKDREMAYTHGLVLNRLTPQRDKLLRMEMIQILI